MLLRPAGERHTNRYGATGAVCAGVRFGAEWAGIVQGFGTGDSAEMAWLGRRLYGEIRAADTIGIQCGVLEILSRFRPAIRERRAPHWVESTQELLRSRLNAPPDLLETARLAGVHPSHLARVFRQFTGMTIGAYLRRLRVEFACSRLGQAQGSLAAIAQEAGFYDQAHFSRVFRRQMGVSPKEYRSLTNSQSACKILPPRGC